MEKSGKILDLFYWVFEFSHMEIIIGNVLFKAFVKGTQNPSCSAKEKKTPISFLPTSALPSEKSHNLPGTPVERLSLNTTVMVQLIFCKNNHYYHNLLLTLLRMDCWFIFLLLWITLCLHVFALLYILGGLSTQSCKERLPNYAFVQYMYHNFW